jgi:hypothetical protein
MNYNVKAVKVNLISSGVEASNAPSIALLRQKESTMPVIAKNISRQYPLLYQKILNLKQRFIKQ